MMEEEDQAALLLSDQLMDEDDDSEIYEMTEDNFEEEDDEIVVGTPEFEEMNASFYINDEEEEVDEGLVIENPFEPVYPVASGALLVTDENVDTSITGKGIVLEAVSLDNILPAGSRRRRS